MEFGAGDYMEYEMFGKMDAAGTCGGGVGGGGRSAGNQPGIAHGDLSGRSGRRRSSAVNSGGVRLLPHSLERAMQEEIELQAPKTAARPSPAIVDLNRSGATENDEFYFPLPLGDRAARRATAYGSAERVSAWMEEVEESLQHAKAPFSKSDALGVVTSIEAAKNTSLQIMNKLADQIAVLQRDVEAHAAGEAEQKRIVADREERIKQLQDQLAEAKDQLHAKDSLIKVQQETIKALATSEQSPNDNAAPGKFAGPQRVFMAHGGGEMPARPHGQLPTWRTYGKQPIKLAPKHADDVFVETNPTLYHQIRENNGAIIYQKSLQELLSSCFNQVEYAIRNIPILDLVPKHRGSPTFKQSRVIKKLQDHLDAKKLAYDLFRDLEGRYWAVIGLVSNALVETIFTQQILGNDMTFAAKTYIKVFNEERDTAEYDHPKVNDLEHRSRLAEQRATSARALVRTQGFWRGLNDISHDTARAIIQDVAICFPSSVIHALTQELHKAVSEAFRIAVRMRQEPNFIEYNFPPTGTPWNAKFHIHRNTELMGKTIEEEKGPRCVQVAIMPLIKSKSFADGTLESKVIHKAEVIVGDRDEMLRALRSHR